MSADFCETVVSVDNFDAAVYGEDFGCRAPATRCSVYMSTGAKGEECMKTFNDLYYPEAKDSVMYNICKRQGSRVCQPGTPAEECLEECGCENRRQHATFNALAQAVRNRGHGAPDQCWWSPCFPEETGTWKSSTITADAKCPTICSMFDDIRNPGPAVINILDENNCPGWNGGGTKTDDETDTGGGEADADFDWRKDARKRGEEATKWVSENPLTTIGLVLIAIIAIIALTALVP